MRFYFSICISLLCIQPVFMQSKQVMPRNETDKDPSLVIFVENLKKAIADKNEAWIISVLDEDVTSTFGDEPGIEFFKLYWSPENDSTDFWPYLTRVVELGGVFLHDTADHTGKYEFVFPYVYDTDLHMDDDFYSMAVVTGKNVNLRSAPNTNSEVIRQLSYDVVIFVDDEESMVSPLVEQNQYGDPAWYQVKTFDKTHQGWVNWQYLAAPYGPRLFLFKDDDGQWKVSAFVAGD